MTALDRPGPLAAAAVTLINEVVYLAGDSLHANPKDGHLPGHQNVQGARLKMMTQQTHYIVY